MSRTVYLEDIDLSYACHGISRPIGGGVNAMDKPMILGGKTYGHGLGMHATGSAMIDLARNGLRFRAVVGKDDEQIGVVATRPVQFLVYGDNELLWQSGIMQAGDTPQEIDLDIRGIMVLHLVLRSAGCDTRGAIANWAEARLEIEGDEIPFTFKEKQGLHTLREWELTTVDEPRPAVVLTPPAPSRPRINSPRVFGARPGSPILYNLAASGQRPFTYAVDRLPPGLHFDTATGRLRGRTIERGTYRIPITVSNAHGSDSIELVLTVGDALSLTPPMGWESWNCWGAAIDDAKTREAARMLVESGLADHGWEYVIVDDGWQGFRDPSTGALSGNGKFPDMQALCDYIHGLGLKVGIYSTPWATSYMGLPGGSADTPEGKVLRNRRDYGVYPFHRQDAAQFARWGADLLKYDWVNDVPHAVAMGEALKAQHRDIVYSISGAIPFTDVRDHARIANYWRTNPDITDKWESVYRRGFYHYRWEQYQRPGNWNDPDMMVVGVVGWGKEQHQTRLTPDEQYAHVSLWALYAAPMLLGCDLSKLDEFTMGLLTNDEIIALNQDPLGVQARRVRWATDGSHVYAKPLCDGSIAVGLFNTSASDKTLRCSFEELGLSDEKMVRDVWRQQDLGVRQSDFSADVAPHGAVVVTMR